ncbi:hypothetical protein PtA15_7A47 [Puccinia triticina]|uniref:Uncharacterized protein n=1 Tax=Puccinia triticina TaxID=208348 RepID=A0ABY7CQB3_9BASI|nr:uncharacterized protein PtA15_7A47 [Puccinia triticina]WAQ86321.1 hypothetical protein PtA15_7A47 [Puccinia triticina]
MPPTRVQLTHAQLQWLQEMQQLIDQEMTDREELGGIPAYRKDNPYQHFT